MEEKELKTSTKQRVVIGLIALIMVGSMVASYAAIVINGNKSSSASSSETTKVSDERIAYYQDGYASALDKFKSTTAGDFAKFQEYLSAVGEYDETAANEGEVKTKDRAVGEGREIGAEDSDYLAYYVGWCADGSVFDSSLDSVSNPTAFAKALDVSIGMIDGWTEGATGMRIGGVRRITIPGAKAYGENMEICGGYNKPLRFLAMAVAKEDPLKSVASELDTAYMKLQYANYGIDYEEQMQSQ